MMITPGARKVPRTNLPRRGSDNLLGGGQKKYCPSRRSDGVGMAGSPPPPFPPEILSEINARFSTPQASWLKNDARKPSRPHA